jgi:hypothetical protein
MALEPRLSGVDFFVQSVTGENCLVVPPICLIARALHYLQKHKAKATVIVPFLAFIVFLAGYIETSGEFHS